MSDTELKKYLLNDEKGTPVIKLILCVNGKDDSFVVTDKDRIMIAFETEDGRKQYFGSGSPDNIYDFFLAQLESSNPNTPDGKPTFVNLRNDHRFHS